MHTLMKHGTQWEVGYWTPPDSTGEIDDRASIRWVTIATLAAPKDAAMLVNFLNGGPGHVRLDFLAEAGGIKFSE